MRYLISFFVLFIFNVANANRITIQVDPSKPVINEPFKATVLIETTESERPSFSFNPVGVEVLDRREEGISTQTTIINGQISMKRIYQIVYTLNASRLGTVRLTNVKATIGSKSIQGDPVTIDVVSERAAPRLFFVRAEPTKSNVFMGEGFNIEYYLYFRVPVVNLEILDFPKLNGFIKRFHMTNDHHETIEVDGSLYRRRKAYSARVYPEKTGELQVDPIRLNVHYSDQTSGSLSAFGFNSRQQARSIFSENVTINVASLPLNDLPTNFIGLVGEHTFKIEVKRDRFLKNEVVEISLEIEGEGALENLSPPKILNHPAFEEFDVKQEFREISPRLAKKIFNYTYIAREAIKLPSDVLAFSYFSIDQNVYKKIELIVPDIVVADNNSSVDFKAPKETIIGSQTETNNLEQNKKLIAPIFKKEPTNLFAKSNLTRYVILALTMGLTTIWILLLVGGIKRKRDEDFKRLLQEIRKNGASYQRLFAMFDYSLDLLKNEDLRDCIMRSGLKEETKVYFQTLLDDIESAEFVRSRKKSGVQFEKRHYDELYKLIEKRKMVHG